MNSDWTWPWKWCCARKGKMRYLIFSLDFLWGTQKPKWRKGSCHTTNNPIFGQGASARGAMWEQAKYFTISLTRTCTMSSAGETVYLNLATRRFIRGRHKQYNNSDFHIKWAQKLYGHQPVVLYAIYEGMFEIKMWSQIIYFGAQKGWGWKSRKCFLWTCMCITISTGLWASPPLPT